MTMEEFSTDSASLEKARARHQEQRRGEFNAAASQGKKYLLVITETNFNHSTVEFESYTRAIDRQSEIKPLLEDLNPEPYYGNQQLLSGIFDLHASFDSQYGTIGQSQIQSVLSPETLFELRNFKKTLELRKATFLYKNHPPLQTRLKNLLTSALGLK